MTDLELMLMLEEYGYEPSIENVKFLKEDLGLLAEDYLDEGVRDAKQGVKDAKRYVGSQTEHDAGGRLGDALDVKEKTQADLSASKQALKIARDRRRNAVGNALRNEPVRRNEEVPMKELVKPSTQMMTAKNDHKSSTALPDKKKEDSYGKVAVNAGVEYSDYELYQLLDESGYKPTEKNLYLLKEGLESGKYEIIDEGFHPIKALQTYRFYTEKYVKPNKKNAKLAKKDPESTKQNIDFWQNRFGAAKEERKIATRIALTDRIPEEKK